MREGELVVGDGGFDGVGVADAGEEAGVEAVDEVELAALEGGRLFRAGCDVGDGLVAGLEDGALISWREGSRC